MVTALTPMMAVGTATKLVPLLTIIDNKQQWTNDINNNPPVANFQWHLLQSTIIASLSHSHPF
jgi:hypothetical protein